jgi:hypothetical protein
VRAHELNGEQNKNSQKVTGRRPQTIGMNLRTSSDKN